MTIYVFSQLVLNWYHKHGRKNLPWQKDKTLYTVWISEIMLQQTTVKSVVPYFKNFIFNFPNIDSLIHSKLDKILYVWSGLGYYRRAQNIYKTAQIIKTKFQGIFPNQFLELIKLPGIGKSTAGAILSFSLDFFYPILDGNIKRILIRYYGIIGSTKDKKIEKKLWNIIELITPIHNTGKFNQAIMDIGSCICTPTKPNCSICPLQKTCFARIQGKCEEYPLKNQKKILLKKKSWFIILKLNNSFWLEKNAQDTIWKNLFCFPKLDTKKMVLNWLEKNKINVINYKKMILFSHKFSHFILCIHPILINVSNSSRYFEENNQGIWYNLEYPQHIGLPQAVKKIFYILKKQKRIT